MKIPSIDTILLGSQYIGIELFSSKGEDWFALVTVDKNKNGLEISQRNLKSDLSQLVNKTDKSVPFSLVINNNQIIQKEVDFADANNSKILAKAFPNLKIDDFYYEISNFGSKSLIAICRKGYVEGLIEKGRNLDVLFSKVSLGICGFSQILEYTELNTFQTNTQTIVFSDTDPIIKNLSDNPLKTYSINGLEVQSRSLMAFSSVISLLMDKVTNGNIDLLNKGLKDLFYQKSFFKKSLKAFLFIIMIMLFINFIAFNHYFRAVEDSSADIAANKNSIEKIRNAKKRVKSKEERMMDNSKGTGSRSSYLLNEIVKNLPSTILLSELNYHPLEKKIKEDENIVTLDKVIIISGITISNDDFTNWIEKIDKLYFVKNSVITNYGRGEDKETSFSIKIVLK